jgi:hypothetical protein
MNKQVWIIDRMILAIENCPSATLSTTNPMLGGVQVISCLWESRTILHTISFAFTYAVFENLFLYLPILCQNIVLCKFLINASMEFICISLFQMYQKPGSLQQ